jgi:D-alanine-D-alanine ligase-like ATP-grasp enzyme
VFDNWLAKDLEFNICMQLRLVWVHALTANPTTPTPPPVRICLLTTQDLDETPFPENDWPCDPRPYLPEDDWHVEILEDKFTSVKAVNKLIAQDFDLYFNLCDGAFDQESPGIEVVRTLEKHGVPFTGATSKFYEPTRRQQKVVCRKLGIATPAWVIAKTEEQVERAAKKLRFPLFVKHYCSYASVDLSRHSRVQTVAGLRRQARKIISKHGAALIEEYIDGTECAVLVAENHKNPARPITYTPIQYNFPEGESFKHSDLKWVDYEGLSAAPVANQKLDALLRDQAARFFTALNGASFGRCDIRVDRDGVPHMLEINPNCGLYYPPKDAGSADICLTFDPAGHEGFTRQLAVAAFARQGKRMPRRKKSAGATRANRRANSTTEPRQNRAI